MKKEILLSGLLGGLVIFGWIIVSTTVLPLHGDAPEEIPGDKEIHSLLKDRIPESGIYWMPGHGEREEGRYPDYENEPIFVVYYAGTTPATMMAPTIVELACILLAPMIAAWLLSMASEKILAGYGRRVLFVTVIGLLFAVYGDLFSNKPLDLILLSSINSIVVWTLVGSVIGWRITLKKVKAGRAG